MSASVQFVSRIPADQRRALESLVFFNPCQQRVIDGIVEAIENFGPPEIVEDDGFLRVRVGAVPEAQALFGVDERTGEPLAVAIFVRTDLENVTVLHVGVRADFAAGGPRAHEKLLLRMIKELRRSSLRLKGVRHVDVFYGTNRTLRPRAVSRRAV